MADLSFMIRGRLWPPAEVTGSFTGKTVIVTGSNSGTGFEAALKYVKMDAETVILAVRSLEKGNAAKKSVEEKTSRLNVIQVWELDMDRFESVDRFAQRVDSELKSLDIAVLNAGVLAKTYRPSPEGWESMLQVNTLSTALLSILLLPKLEASSTPSSPAHLEFVASTGHIDAEIEKPESTHLVQDCNTEVGFSTMSRYNLSKLFIMWVARELASRCVASDGSPRVIINDTCPGACRTDVIRDWNNPFLWLLMVVVSTILFKPAEQGARTIVGATQMGKESHGKWWVNDEFEKPGKYITSPEGQEMQTVAWQEILEILRKKVPRVESIVEGLSS